MCIVNNFAPVTMRFINITRMIPKIVIVLRVGVLNENKRKNFALFNSYSGVQNQIELKRSLQVCEFKSIW